MEFSGMLFAQKETFLCSSKHKEQRAPSKMGSFIIKKIMFEITIFE